MFLYYYFLQVTTLFYLDERFLLSISSYIFENRHLLLSKSEIDNLCAYIAHIDYFLTEVEKQTSIVKFISGNEIF